jgi:CheY-like chemotaxis protein
MQLTVTIGPVPTSSALAWIESATETIAVLRDQPQLAVPADVLDAFDRFVSGWADHAQRNPETFLWSEPVEETVVRTLGLHWARIVSVTRSGRAPDLSTAAPEGAAFYDALATGIAGALAAGEDEPIADAFVEAVPTFEPPARPPEPEAPIRVVIVDDREEMRLLLRIWLEGDPGFEVVGEAADGRRAVDVVGETRPDAVVLDVEMPVLSGIEALPLLREVAPACAVVVFSAEQEDEALAAGATAFVSKAHSISRVLDAIRSAVRP